MHHRYINKTVSISATNLPKTQAEIDNIDSDNVTMSFKFKDYNLQIFKTQVIVYGFIT